MLSSELISSIIQIQIHAIPTRELMTNVVSSIKRYLFEKVNKDWLNIRTDNFLNNALSNTFILANKQPLHLQQLPTCSKNTYCQCNKPCHKRQCKICTCYDTRFSIKFGNDITNSSAKTDCDSQNVVYILFSAKCPNADYVGETSNHLGYDLIMTNTALYTIYEVTP